MPRGGGGDPLDARQEGGDAAASATVSGADEHGGAGPAAIPEHPVTIGRPTFRDCAINAVAVVPLLGGGAAAAGGANGNSVGGSHSLESFASLLDSLRHFAKSSASGDEPEMSHGMRMRAEAAGA